jgi:hypothetical protein
MFSFKFANKHYKLLDLLKMTKQALVEAKADLKLFDVLTIKLLKAYNRNAEVDKGGQGSRSRSCGLRWSNKALMAMMRRM